MIKWSCLEYICFFYKIKILILPVPGRFIVKILLMKLSLVQLLFAQIRGMRGKQQKSGLLSPKELKNSAN